MSNGKFLGISSTKLLVIVIAILFIAGVCAGAISNHFIKVPDWLNIPNPEVELPAERVFINSPFTTNTLIGSWLTVIVVMVLALVVKSKLRLVPGRLQTAFEFLFGWLLDFCVSAGGEANGRRFFPLVATIFLYVGFNAWLGLVPGYGSIQVPGFAFDAGTGQWVAQTVHLIRPANTDLNVPLSLALIGFVFTEFYAFKDLGIHYMDKFLNFRTFGKGLVQVVHGKISEGLITLLTGAIEAMVGFLDFLQEFIHIISLTFRLFGNMTAGEMLLIVLTFLVPWSLALPFYGLEALIGFIQALIFAGLTLIFMVLAVTPHNAEH